MVGGKLSQGSSPWTHQSVHIRGCSLALIGGETEGSPISSQSAVRCGRHHGAGDPPTATSSLAFCNHLTAGISLEHSDSPGFGGFSPLLSIFKIIKKTFQLYYNEKKSLVRLPWFAFQFNPDSYQLVTLSEGIGKPRLPCLPL